MKRVFIIQPKDVQAKREALTHIGATTIPIRVEVCEFRPRRTDRQNRFYWPAIVVPFSVWIGQQYNRLPDEDKAHGILKDAYLRVPETNPETGEVAFNLDGNPLMRTRSTTELSIVEFAHYLDQCIEFLADMCDIIVPPDFQQAG